MPDRNQARELGKFAISVGIVYVAAAAVQSADGHLGRSVPQAFYVTVATVVPVLLLAVMVETATAIQLRPLASGLVDITRENDNIAQGLAELAARMRWIIRWFFSQAFIAETAALYAIGADRSSTFLLSLCILPLLIFGVLLWVTYEMRFD
jgi:hypothetical protein